MKNIEILICYGPYRIHDLQYKLWVENMAYLARNIDMIDLYMVILISFSIILLHAHPRIHDDPAYIEAKSGQGNIISRSRNTFILLSC